MRLDILGIIALCCFTGACEQAKFATPEASKSQGRYTGIGVYDAGLLWSHIAQKTQSKDPAAAQLADDENIIVVVDSQTGEIRQCGNLSGFCVKMNPWTSTDAPPDRLPAKLIKHAADIAQADDVAVAADSSAKTSVAQTVK
jgi:hypothetical protein